MKQKLGVLCCATAASLMSIAQGGVFDDAVIWLRGDSDINGDGRIQVGEVVDVFSPTATDAVAPYGWLDGVNGAVGDFVWTNDVIVCPYTMRTNLNAKSYCFRQNLRSDGAVWPNVISFAPSASSSKVTSKDYSFHIRFKWHGRKISTNTAVNYLVNIGGTSSTATNTRGVWFGIWAAGGDIGKIRFHTGSTDGTVGPKLSSNVWTDVVFTMTAENSIEWTIMQEGGDLKTGIFTPSDKNYQPNPANRVSIGHSNPRDGWATASTSATHYNAFIGEVAEFALWNRALSPEDRLRAMAWPNEDLFRVGVANGTSDEFDGEGEVSVHALSPECGWGAFGGDIMAGSSKSIAFAVPVRYDGLPQIFRYRAALDSSSGILAVTLDGNSVGSINVSPGAWSRLEIPATYFSGGTTSTLAISRTDGGATPIKTDAVALGGSWQEGTVSGNQWENSDNNATEPFYLPDGNFTHFRASVKAGRRQTVRFDVPHELAGRYDFKVEYKMLFEGTPANIKVVAYMNGTKCYEEIPSSRAWWTRSFKVPANLIQTGENLLVFANEGDNTDLSSYVSFDYLRLVVEKERHGFIMTVW